MKNWAIIIISLLVLAVTLFLLGKYNPMHMINWFTAIVGIVVGAGALFCAGIHWGKFLGNTL